MNRSAEYKVMLSCGESIFSMNNGFLHCHTNSCQCTAIIIGLSNTLSINTASKNLPSFIPSTSSRGIYSQELYAIAPDEFGQNSETLTTFYENILKKSCCQAVLVTKAASVPVPSHDANANAVDPPADAAPAAPALPPAPAAEAASAPPEKPLPLTPLSKKSGGGNKTSSRACRG
jgi:hypothetical protein